MTAQALAVAVALLALSGSSDGGRRVIIGPPGIPKAKAIQRASSFPPPPPPLGFLSRTLGDNMVLQCAPRQAVVWGNTTAGTTVTTSFGPATLRCTAGPDGVWRQRLPATPASAAPHTLRFASSSGETARLFNVVFGEVHICSGQSNMQASAPVFARLRPHPRPLSPH